MKKKNTSDIKSSSFFNEEDFEILGLAGIFFLWYAYREIQKEAIREYLEQKEYEDLINQDNEEENEDVKRLVRK